MKSWVWYALVKAGIMMIFLGHSISTFAQAATKDKPGTPSSSAEGVLVEIRNEAEVYNVSHPLRIAVKVTNRLQETISIGNIELRLPPSLADTRDNKKISGTMRQVIPDSGTANQKSPEVFSNSVAIFYLEVPDAKRGAGLGGIIPNRAWLTFMPGQYELRVEVPWMAAGNQSGVAEGSARIRMEPDALALMYGSALGSLLLAVFIFSYRATEKASLSNWPRQENNANAVDWRRAGFSVQSFLLHQGCQAAVRFWSGLLIAWILLLFLNYAHDVQIPVTIAVNDFFGAVLLGLFTHSLGRWVYEKLFSVAAQNASAAKLSAAEEEKFGPKTPPVLVDANGQPIKNEPAEAN